MVVIRTLRELKETLQGLFEGNERTLQLYGETHAPQLKVYLTESNVQLDGAPPPEGAWRAMDRTGWYFLDDAPSTGRVFLNAGSDRVWRLLSILDINRSDGFRDGWVSRTKGLDYCWLSRRVLTMWDGQEGWHQRGVGLRFDDGLQPEDEGNSFSLKAWRGSAEPLPGLDQLLEEAKRRFAISSVRWQRREGDSALMTAEVYSDGKITFNRATDAEEVLNFTSTIADRYEKSLTSASDLRGRRLAPFELVFSQNVNLDAFSEHVTSGKGPMKLWLTELESEPDFRRYRGVDMHTWDVVFLSIAPSYGYLTIPRNGCVNAAPRLATIQGEDNAGNTQIFVDGVELFA